jgi:hypothetical protein
MGEPLAIVGLVSNLVSFVDFGIKLASGVRNVRDSTHGTTSEIQELEIIVGNVQKYNRSVLEQKNAGQSFSIHEQGFLDLVKECERVSIDLRKRIDSLHVRNGRMTILEYSRVAFLNLLKRKDTDTLRKRLESLDRLIRSNVEHAFQRYVC